MKLRRGIQLVAALAVQVAMHAARAGSAEAQSDSAKMVNQSPDSLLRGFRWRSIGPSEPGGRADDIAVVEQRPSTFYVGFATGGVWKTINNGVTFTPIFDTYGSSSIGDLAISPSQPDIVYVGTGEANNRQSSSYGDGIYKSADGGKTFAHVGLRETQTIARIIVHPRNPDVVWVAAAGHLFGPNAERGVFKSTDGGRSWNRTLQVDVNTGATDLIIDPTNPDVLFAATYARQRTAWGYVGGGAGSGIWKSTDGGAHWTRLSGSGLPAGTMGRIALDISRSNPRVIYAQIEVASDASDASSSGVWRSADGGASWQFMSNENNRPSYYSQIRVDPQNENVVWVAGAGVSRSTDGGKTWRAVHGYGHGDHHAIWIDPANSDHVMDGNDGGVDVTWDGGANWHALRTDALGQAYHAAVDMRRPYFVCAGLQDNGSWCGPSSVRSGPVLSQDWYRVAGGDGFYGQVNPSDYTIVYSEQDGGNMSRLELREGTAVSIRPRATSVTGRGSAAPSNIVPSPDTSVRLRFNWNTPILLSPHDPNTVYTGGNRFFKSRDRGTTWSMSADLTRQIARDARAIMGVPGSLPACSRQRHDACILSKNDGVSAYGTITTIAESSVSPGVLWVGTDDGSIQVSRDGGATWTEVSRNLPGGSKEYYVSRVEASHFDESSAYVSLDGHRSDDLKPYVFATRDFGKTWSSLSSNLPVRGNVNTVKQDPRNRNLLYAGTELGVFVSLDDGRKWTPLMTNLPVVRVDDILVHPRDNDLILTTHGRSIWIMDDITPLQQLTQRDLAADVALLEPRIAVAWKPDIRLRRVIPGDHHWRGENAPQGTVIAYYLQRPANGEVKMEIRPVGSDAVFRTMSGTSYAGLNQLRWDLCSDVRSLQPGESAGAGAGGGGAPGHPIRDVSRPPDPCFRGTPESSDEGAPPATAGQPRRAARLAAPGAYVVTLTVNGRQYSRAVTVLEDAWMEQR